MITTTFTCDRCGSEARAQDTMISVGLTYSPGSQFFQSHAFPYVTKLWCDGCARHFGIKPRFEGTPAPNPPPTLDDLIRDLIREMVREEVHS